MNEQVEVWSTYSILSDILPGVITGLWEITGVFKVTLLDKAPLRFGIYFLKYEISVHTHTPLRPLELRKKIVAFNIKKQK